MMRKTITRTLATSKISGCKLTMVNGVPQPEMLEAITVAGKVSDNEALKALKDVYGKSEPIVVTQIEVDEALYEISVNDFMKHAVKVEKKETVDEELVEEI